MSDYPTRFTAQPQGGAVSLSGMQGGVMVDVIEQQQQHQQQQHQYGEGARQAVQQWQGSSYADLAGSIQLRTSEDYFQRNVILQHTRMTIRATERMAELGYENSRLKLELARAGKEIENLTAVKECMERRIQVQETLFLNEEDQIRRLVMMFRGAHHSGDERDGIVALVAEELESMARVFTLAKEEMEKINSTAAQR